MNHSPLRLPLLLGLAAIVVTLAFAAFTGHRREDSFIAFRASLNFTNGHGLVLPPGERVRSFTSPLGTLRPALFVGLAWQMRAQPAMTVADSKPRLGRARNPLP